MSQMVFAARMRFFFVRKKQIKPKQNKKPFQLFKGYLNLEITDARSMLSKEEETYYPN